MERTKTCGLPQLFEPHLRSSGGVLQEVPGRRRLFGRPGMLRFFEGVHRVKQAYP